MKTVLNFSHPLSHAAVERLKEMVGSDLEIHEIAMHFDLSKPLEPQIQAAIHKAGVAKVSPDYIVPPGLSPAAIVVSRIYPAAKIVRLSAHGTPPQWLPAEIF